MNSLHKRALVNGCVRTMDESCSQAEAVLIAGDRIEAVGTSAEIISLADRYTEILDMKGAALFPGFIDTHSHLSMYSMYSDQAYCGAEVGNLEGALARLREHAAKCGPGELVFGWGYDDSILPEGRGPTRKELDAISVDSPVLVLHISAHVAYANSKALELAGLNADTRMEGGEVVLGEDGTPDGTLLELTAFKALELFRSPEKERLRGLLHKGISDYNRQGFTATHEAGVGLGGINPAEYLRLLHDMEQDESLNLRLYLSFFPKEFDKFVQVGIGTGFGGKMIKISGPKIFNDGSLQMYTGALLKPYHGRPDHKGALLTPADQMAETLIKYHCDGYQISYHGNGDAGIECMISAIEQAQKICPRKDPRHILVHCQTASDEQLARMHDAGILPSFFGLHVWYYGDRHYEIFLGPERAERLDPSGSAVRLGMKHSLHADSPVLPPWSLRSIHTAVNRITRNGRLLGEDQRISIEEAVRAYTSHAAFFHFEEKERGSIEPGKLADFVLLSDDLLTMPPEDLMRVEVLMTMLGGRVVYGEFPAS